MKMVILFCLSVVSVSGFANELERRAKSAESILQNSAVLALEEGIMAMNENNCDLPSVEKDIHYSCLSGAIPANQKEQKSRSFTCGFNLFIKCANETVRIYGEHIVYLGQNSDGSDNLKTQVIGVERRKK